jgi:hypothetical protein
MNVVAPGQFGWLKAAAQVLRKDSSLSSIEPIDEPK